MKYTCEVPNLCNTNIIQEQRSLVNRYYERRVHFSLNVSLSVAILIHVGHVEISHPIIPEEDVIQYTHAISYQKAKVGKKPCPTRHADDLTNWVSRDERRVHPVPRASLSSNSHELGSIAHDG